MMFLRVFLVVLCLIVFSPVTQSDAATEGLTASFEGNIPKAAIRQFFPGGQYILLTFSGGPHRDITAEILSILQNASVHANFFVSAEKSLVHPRLLTDIVAGKHDLGHSGFYSTVSLSRKSKEEISAQIAAASSLMKNLTQREVVYFRPPGYFISDALSDWINENHKTKTILWSIDVNYLLKDLKKSAQDVAEIVRTKAKPGDIINFAETRATVRALPVILETLKKLRYELLTLTQVLSFPDDSPH